MDVSINIGLGNGDTNERLQALMMISAKQQEALTQLGPQNPLVSPSMYASTLRKIVELSGFKDSSQFFNDIPADYQPPAPPPPKPTPEEVLAEVQAKSIEADIQKKAAELELKREQMIRDDDFRRDELAQSGLLKKYEIELKYNAQISNAEIQAAWFALAIPLQYRGDGFQTVVEQFLTSVGRRKFLTPTYKAMLEAGDQDWAMTIYQAARPGYHAVATQTMDDLLGFKPAS